MFFGHHLSVAHKRLKRHPYSWGDVFRGTESPVDLAVPSLYLRGNESVLHVAAYSGDHTLQAATQVPDGRVVAVDICPVNIDQLRQKIDQPAHFLYNYLYNFTEQNGFGDLIDDLEHIPIDDAALLGYAEGSLRKEIVGRAYSSHQRVIRQRREQKLLKPLHPILLAKTRRQGTAGALHNLIHVLEYAQTLHSAKSRIEEYHVADASRLPFENETFDAIFCVDVLCLINGQGENKVRSSVNEMLRVLKRGGRFAFLDFGFSSLMMAACRWYGKTRPFQKEGYLKDLVPAYYQGLNDPDALSGRVNHALQGKARYTISLRFPYETSRMLWSSYILSRPFPDWGSQNAIFYGKKG